MGQTAVVGPVTILFYCELTNCLAKQPTFDLEAGKDNTASQ